MPYIIFDDLTPIIQLSNYCPPPTNEDYTKSIPRLYVTMLSIFLVPCHYSLVLDMGENLPLPLEASPSSPLSFA
jgi:hypothetical protein